MRSFKFYVKAQTSGMQVAFYETVEANDHDAAVEAVKTDLKAKGFSHLVLRRA